MSRFRDVLLARGQRETQFEKDQKTFLAVLAGVDYANSAAVARQPGHVWFQELEQYGDATPGIAFNRKAPPIPGLKVTIKQWPKAPFDYEVIDWDATGIKDLPDYTGTPLLPQHAQDHIDGYDPLILPTRNLAALRTYITPGNTTLKVNVAPYGDFGGQNDLNLSASKPASGLARYVLVYLDPTDNTIKTVNGDTATDLDTVPPTKPAVPSGGIASAYVRIDGDQTAISEADIVEARSIFSGSGGGWPFTTSLITVDPSGNADHSALDAAISAASAGDCILFDGLHTITGSALAISKALTIQGVSKETAIITSTLNGATVDMTAAAILRSCTVKNTGTGTNGYGVQWNSAVLIDDVDAIISGAKSTAAYGFRAIGGAGWRLRNSRGIASGASTRNNGLRIESAAQTGTVDGGYYSGGASTAPADIMINHASADITLKNPCFGTDRLYVLAGTIKGTALDSKGRDAGVIVKNASGTDSVRYAVGYLENGHSWNMTTTDYALLDWHVCTIGGSPNGQQIFVKNRGNATIRYIGTAPSQNNFLVTSTSLGYAQGVSSLHPAIMATCLAGGSGGTVEVLLLTQTGFVPFTSGNPLQQSPTLVSASEWTGTIATLPGGAILTFSTTSGDKKWLVPVSTTALAKLVLHNLTPGRTAYALISTAVAASNSVTLTTNVPGDWQVGDTITIDSQTNLGVSGSAYFLDYQVTGISGLPRALAVDYNFTDISVNGIRTELHPFSSFAGASAFFLNANTSTILARTVLVPLISSRYTIRANASGVDTIFANVYIMGYFEARA